MKNPHSVVTAHLIDREGEPTRQALDEILGLLPHAAAGRKKESVRAVGVAFGTGLTTISRAPADKSTPPANCSTRALADRTPTSSDATSNLSRRVRAARHWNVAPAGKARFLGGGVLLV